MVGILDEMCPQVQKAIIGVVPSNITWDKSDKVIFSTSYFSGNFRFQIPLTRKMFYSLFHISQTTKILGRRHYIRQLLGLIFSYI